jgi:exosortase
VLDVAGVPVLREGNIIHFAGKSLEVAQACSGMRLLIGFVAMGIAVAHLSRKPLWHKAIIVCSTFPIAVLTNAARVTGTGFLYHSVSESLAEGFFHAFSGWLLFVAALGVLLLESYLLTKAAASGGRTR